MKAKIMELKSKMEELRRLCNELAYVVDEARRRTKFSIPAGGVEVYAEFGLTVKLDDRMFIDVECNGLHLWDFERGAHERVEELPPEVEAELRRAEDRIDEKAKDLDACIRALKSMLAAWALAQA
jgi:hypothetical protein